MMEDIQKAEHQGRVPLEALLGSHIVTHAEDLVILCREGKAEDRLREIMGKLKLTTRISKVPEGESDSGDTKWAARYLDLACSTLNKARLYGTGPPFFRLGRAVRYRRSDLDEWRNRFRATSTTEADATLPRSLTTAGPKRDAR